MEAKCRRAERALHEKDEGEKELREEIQKLEDATYVCYKQGFNKALTEVKHFSSGTSIDLSRVDQEMKLDEILVEGAPTNQDTPEAAMGPIIQINGEEDEEEEGGNPRSLPRLVVINSFFFLFFL